MFNKFTISIFGLLLLFATNLSAQTIPNNIDNRFRIQNAFSSDSDAQNALLTGKNDILLLRRTKLLTFIAQASASETNNAALTPIDAEYDKIGNGQIGVRFSTNVANRFNVFADLSALGVRYKRRADLDYSALSGAIGIHLNHKGLDFSLSHQPSIVFDRGFDKRQLKQSRSEAQIGYPIIFKGFYVNPTAHYARISADPADYNHASYGAELGITKRILKRQPLYANVNYSFSRRQYESYFADFLGTDRNDRNKSIDFGLRYDLNDKMSLNLKYEMTRNYSTSDVNEYKVENKAIGLSLNMRF